MPSRAATGPRRRCPSASCSRGRRIRQRGLTLIETVVTVAVLAVGVVGIASSLAAVERIAGISQNQSQLEVSMRQLSDWVRNSTSATCSSGTCPSLPYRYCATNPSTYNAFVANAEAAGTLTSSIGSAPIQSVKVSTAGTRTGSTGTVAMPSLTSCGGGGGDWGVQEITLKITANGNTVQRVVWKSLW